MQPATDDFGAAIGVTFDQFDDAFAQVIAVDGAALMLVRGLGNPQRRRHWFPEPDPVFGGL